MTQSGNHNSQSRARAADVPRLAPTGRKGKVRRKSDSASSDSLTKHCVNCGAELTIIDNVPICSSCNTPEVVALATGITRIGVAAVDAILQMDDGTTMIECPGATRYDEVTGEVTEGAEFVDLADGSYQVRVVLRHIFPPNHCKRRVLSPEARGKIRRCQACQDYTVRIRRREGVDFCVPSRKFPHRTKLRTVDDSISHVKK